MKETSSQSGSGPAGEPSAAALQRALADRERQLRDLTEQSLGFLEELAEARRRNADRDQLAQRIGELERLIADAQRRLQQAGGTAAIAADDGQPRPPLEVVFWGPDSHVAAVAAAAAGHPVTWVGPPDDVPTGRPPKGLPTVVSRDARTPAQCWNLGLAATRAEAVLFVGPGLEITALAADEAALAKADLAIACPRVRRGDRDEFGFDTVDDLLHLSPHRATGDHPTAGPFASARAFAIRRAAFERIGAFDEGVAGEAALLDWTLRARRHGFGGAAAPGCALAETANAAPARDVHTIDDRARLLLIAAHFGDRLGRALAEAGTLWQVARDDAPALLAQLLARLPRNGDDAIPRELLDRIALGLAEQGQPAARIAEQVNASRLQLLRALAESEPPHCAEEVATVLNRALQRPPTTPAEAFRALDDVIGLAHRTGLGFRSVLQQTRSEKQHLDTERHTQAARAERAVGSREAVQAQLDEAVQSLRASQEHARQLEVQFAELKVRHAEFATRLADADSRHAQAEARHAEADAQFAAASEHTRALMEAIEKDRRQAAAVTEQFETLRREHAQLTALLGVSGDAPAGEVQNRLGDLQKEAHRLHSTLQSTLRAAGASDPENLIADLRVVRDRYAAAEKMLGERERWIALLLAEVQKRRLRPRALLPHERDLIERLGSP